MNRIEQRVKRLEEEAPRPRCNHPVGVFLNPSEDERAKLKRELAACPNCGPGAGPAIMVIEIKGDEQGRVNGDGN